jgi:hypothetical protein
MKIPFWIIGELLLLAITAVVFFITFVNGLMTLPIASLFGLGLAILCSVKSEQRNAD